MTDPTPTCPPRTELVALLSGQISNGRATELEAHVEGCRRCQAEFDALAGDSLLLRALQNPLPDPADVREDLQDLISQLESLHPSAGPEATNPPAEIEIGRLLAPPAGPDELGRLAHYRVLSVIGAGGMGVVLRADDTQLGRPVALKVMRTSAGRDSAWRQRFRDEARAMAAIRHDHIVVVHQVGEVTGPSGEPVPFLAMELLDGQSLDAWLRTNPRPSPAWAARIGRQAAEGLSAAHARGLIHRDVKPANLWLEAPSGSSDLPTGKPLSLGEVGRVKLLDFGLATATGEAGGRAGTPAYMAPEQLAQTTLDARVDLYALGCVLYEMATGYRPFPDRRFTALAASEIHQPLPAREVNPDIPRAFSELIDRLLCPDPNGRPASARHVAQELAAIEATLRGAERGRWDLGRRARRAAFASGLAVAVLSLGFATVNWLTGANPNQKAGPVAARPASAVPPGPPDATWCAAVAALPPDVQVTAVRNKLTELNPDFDPQDLRVGFDPTRGTVRELFFPTDLVSDIRPVGALTDLKVLGCCGSAPGTGRLRDLTAVSELKLDTLWAWNNPLLENVSAVRKMPLTELHVGDTGIDSLKPLAGSTVEVLAISNTKVRDLGSLQSLPKLRVLRFDGCPISSTEPLAATRIVELVLDYRPERDDPVFARMPGLRRVNFRPVPGRN
jgi:eukaryotic-like serine/threonine-protein kinase